ncbi:MAG: Eco57I restriction-modification methylase domain-containing protein [Gemmatimonadota bacterium]|nr:Eco57I restriction-modification methylase domain-containing protein [Gemmatimonadota bacterium]
MPGFVFDNRSLFSDHYLAERLPAHPAWNADAAERTAAWQRLRTLYADRAGRLPALSEAQAEDEWIRPVLVDALGWTYEVQTAVTGAERRTNWPDYSLFIGEAEKSAAQAARGDERAYYAHVAAVADAKYWERPLDRKLRDARDLSNANPAFQIVAYLMATGVEWGILTNGREWRLYSGRARSRIDTYYAVDLPSVLEEGDEETFRYFWLFFRAAAFQPDPRTGEAFVDAVHRGSVEYGAEVEVRLKGLIFREVFPELARGFVQGRRRRGLPADTEESLQEVYAGTLRLLYRILFVLHAEARGLLPVDDRDGYYGYSLSRIRQKVADHLREGRLLSTVSTDVWNDLAGLFLIIDQGDPALAIPRYNGGLFRADHPQNRFLATHSVADAFLLGALDRLSRDAEGRFIDYKALSVEQLGSLYEGLLEFRLRPGPDGAPTLENDKGERKATGSYYTPHYVVEYIVAHTVGPAVAEREARFRMLMEEIGPKRSRLREIGAKLAADPKRSDAAVSRWTIEAGALRRELKTLEPQAVDTLLGIRVCDPAMGSGHFLVYAANWLTERWIALLNEFPENPVLERIAEIREQIVVNLAEQGIRVDAGHLRDTNLLKRMVMKRCIYGVDLNPMATELAKLSLWLDSFTVGAPLSFLDHHLKTGNSLVGTTVQAMRAGLEASDTGQFDVFGGPFAGLLQATALMRDVGNTTDATFEEVAHSAERFAEFEGAVGPYKRLLDLWTSRAFGNRRAQELATLHGQEVLAAAKGVGADFAEPQREALKRAAELSGVHHFFHWDLEFPEVFVELALARWKANPGFDAVIGNPPYVRQEKLTPLKPFLENSFASYHGVADLYLYFFEQGLRILREGGRLAYISSGTFARANFATAFRELLPTLAQMESVIDFGENQPFEDAEMVRPSIVVLRRGEQAAPFRSLFIDGEIPKSLGDAVEEHGFDCDPAALVQAEWTFQPASHTRLIDKVMRTGTPLLEVVDGQLYRGITTGLNEVFIIDQEIRDRLMRADPRSAEIIKPVLQGQDLRPWYQEDEGRWLVFTRRGIDLDAYPAVAGYLGEFREQLEPRPAEWNGRKTWPGRKPGSYKWYEIQDSIDYHLAFEQPKIFWPDIAKLPRFSWGESKVYIANTGYIIPAPDPFLLGTLQSRVSWFAISQICQPLPVVSGQKSKSSNWLRIIASVEA